MNLFDLYSCFPSATLLQAREMGLDLEKLPSLTITGGLPYFGGPGNSYTLHAIVEAAERLRKNPEKFAFISALGWYFTKYSAGIYSGQEPGRPWDRKGQGGETICQNCAVTKLPTRLPVTQTAPLQVRG